MVRSKRRKSPSLARPNQWQRRKTNPLKAPVLPRLNRPAVDQSPMRPRKQAPQLKRIPHHNLNPLLLRNIPLLLAGSDVIGSAHTGPGKTAAFALPILSKMDHHEPQPRVLILEPTRELAAQVETAFRDFPRFPDLPVGVVFGRHGSRLQ